MDRRSKEIVRFLLQNIEEEDRYFMGERSDAAASGDARDLQFRPEAEFFSFFRDMFPNKTVKTQEIDGDVSHVEVLSGTVLWEHPTGDKSAIMEIWSSNETCPNACSIANISQFTHEGSIKTDPHGGRSIFMMFQQGSGDIHLYFTTETSLRHHNWDPRLKTFAQQWFAHGCKSAFRDFIAQKQYPPA